MLILQAANKLTNTLTEAVATMQASTELKAPDRALFEGLDTRPASLGRAAANDALVAHVNEVLLAWCGSVGEALAQPQQLPLAQQPSEVHRLFTLLDLSNWTCDTVYCPYIPFPTSQSPECLK